MKSKLHKDLKALFTISLLSYKNRIIEIFKNLLKAVGAVLQILIFLGIFLLPSLLKKSKAVVSINISPYSLYIGGAIFILLTLITIQSLRKAVKNYLPGTFSKPDVNLVFPSPIDKRVTYFYSFLRSFGLTILTLFIYSSIAAVISVSMHMALLWDNAGFAIGGLFLFIVFIQSSRFFLYSFNKKFGKARETRLTLLACAGILLVWVIASWFHGPRDLKSLLSTAGGDMFQWVPVIGWTKALICSLFYEQQLSLLYLLLNLVVSAAVMMLSVVWANDYYEEVGEVLGKMDQMVASASRGDFDAMYNSGLESNNKEINPSFEGKREKAFLYKDLLIYMRKKQGKKLSILWNLLFTAAGIAIAYFTRNTGKSAAIYIMLFSGYMYSIVSMEIGGIAYEIKHVYFYILPGRVKNKIVWASMFPVLRAFVQLFLFAVPFMFVKNVHVTETLTAYIAICSFAVVKSCEKIIKIVILPDDNKNILLVYIMGIAQLLFNVPGFLFGGLTYYLTKNLSLALIAFVPGEIISILLMLMISEKLFKRVELKG